MKSSSQTLLGTIDEVAKNQKIQVTLQLLLGNIAQQMTDANSEDAENHLAQLRLTTEKQVSLMEELVFMQLAQLKEEDKEIQGSFAVCGAAIQGAAWIYYSIREDET
jgi:hypothetical protein